MLPCSQDALFDQNSESGVLASVPSALTRWTEEARVLDGDSMHDIVTGQFLEIFTPFFPYLGM